MSAALAQHAARRLHRGQVDKQGRDYFDQHLATVAAMAVALAEGLGFDDAQVDRVETLAWLHDAIEDQGLTEQGLVDAGLSRLLWVDLNWLTHHKGDPYQEYVEAIAGDAPDEVVVVKLADNLVNSSTLAALDPDTRARLSAKYRRARKPLMARFLNL